ncbi:hypothetical protein CDAR_596191 [Caerostris darwini]|uniref:Condensin complex subunit 2 n=1 Tax=Caerostris darwini TaxID=1538125 RepID=A0AAV4UXM3_9ARAC|nr:hypothetical protein CDAR_596191 [Caerostris darwini]
MDLYLQRLIRSLDLRLKYDIAVKSDFKMEEFLNSSITNDHGKSIREQGNNVADSMVGMTDQEIQQHLDHCMKLSAENKINMKNAFGLHLINIMRNLFKKQESTDLTLASLSLQASSKIYASRIDALHKETCQFHGHLQTITSGKTASNAASADDAMDDEINDRKTQKKKLKSYLSSEDSVSVSSNQGNLFMVKPHGNFNCIKSAFSTSSSSKRLLDSLQMECDSCKISCAVPSKCFKLRESLPNPVKFHLKRRISDRLEAIDKIEIKSIEFEDTIHASKTPEVFSNGDSWGDCNDSSMEINNHEMDVMIDRFSVLDITADIFARDISQAITKKNVIDETLLPPQSALKKVLRSTVKKPRITEGEKKKRERKPREPFFTKEQSVNNSLFAIGKKINLTNSIISKWHPSDTTELCTGHNKFFVISIDSEVNSVEKGKEFSHIFIESDPKILLKDYFFKRTRPWMQCRKLRSTKKSVSFSTAVASPGMLRGRDTEFAAIAENEELVQSLRDLSLNDPYDGSCADDGPLDLPSPINSDDESGDPAINRSRTLDDDIQQMMVTPPKLVKPLNVRFHQKPLAIDLDSLKSCMWKIISEKTTQSMINSINFSDVYSEVQKRYKTEKKDDVPQQFAFVVLLILANEKELDIGNIDNKDLFIQLNND